MEARRIDNDQINMRSMNDRMSCSTFERAQIFQRGRRSKMKKVALILAVVLTLASLSLAGSPTVRGQVRNPSGKLLYNTKTTGNTTEVRNPSGKLIIRSKTTGNKTEVRSPTGKLLETIKTTK